MYTHETKSSNHKVVANQMVQRRGGQTAPKAFVDRRSSNESQCALQRVMVRKPIVHMDKKLNKAIYYGFAQAREDYMVENKLINRTAHCTVDELNGAIGLTNDSLSALPMGAKREKIQAVVAADDGDLSIDEKDWKMWLQERIDVLQMPKMTGEQCRHDLNMYELENSVWRRFISFFGYNDEGTAFKSDVDSNKISINSKRSNDANQKTWTAEDHSANVAKRAPTKYYWTPEQILAHDNFVGSNNYTCVDCCNKLKDSLGVPLQNHCHIIELTLEWLRDDVMHRFWRLTSLMGLDFFVAKKKRIVFVREENPGSHSGVGGRKPITDSEWEHAEQLGYVRNGFVKRVDPIGQTLYEKWEQEEKWKRERKRGQKRRWKQRRAQ